MGDPTPLVGVGVTAALIAGLSGGLHCALMCGPLASVPVARTGGAGGAGARMGWHFGRFAAYSAVGAALGVAGGGLATAIASTVQQFLPWLMVAGLVASAFEFGRRLPARVAPGGLARRIARFGAARAPFPRAALLGAATPFLPCGLLWGIYLVAAGAGSAPGGALVMGAFALGSAPALAAVQLGAGWAGRWPRAERAIRIGTPLAAAAVVAWRALIAPEAAGHGGHGSAR